MALVALVGILLISILDLSNADFRVRPSVHTNNYGTVEHFCVYQGINFLSGSSFKLASPDCVDCSCTDGGMTCWGYGAMAGLMMVEGCRQVSDFCQIRFVDMQDPTKPCAAFRPRAPVLATDSTTVLTTNSTTLLTTDSTTVLTTDSTTTTIPNLPSDAGNNNGQSESDSSND